MIIWNQRIEAVQETDRRSDSYITTELFVLFWNICKLKIFVNALQLEWYGI